MAIFQSSLLPWLDDAETVYDLLTEREAWLVADREVWAHSAGVVEHIDDSLLVVRDELSRCAAAMQTADDYAEWCARVDAMAEEAEEEALWIASRDARQQFHAAPVVLRRAA